MLDLLNHFSLSTIITFLILLALAVKSVVSFLDWIFARFNKVFNKKQKKIKEKENLDEKIKEQTEMIQTLQSNQSIIDTKLKDLEDKIDMLIDSDKDDIKAYITREHHFFCYHQHWIDDFSLDCLEKRYQHYAKQGGNSFIENFMEELRALPKQQQSIQK